MSHSIETPYYELPLFDPDDVPQWLEDFNDAMTKIDTAIHNINPGQTINVVQNTGTSPTDVMSQAAVTESLANKQDTLISGTNIATINGQNLLNGGNITIAGGSGETVDIVQETGTSQTAVMSQNATTTALNGKQTTLISGTNIKTINGQSLLGAGDIPISGSETTPTIVTHDQLLSSNDITSSKTTIASVQIQTAGTYLVYGMYEMSLSSIAGSALSGVNFIRSNITKVVNGEESDVVPNKTCGASVRNSTSGTENNVQYVVTLIGTVTLPANSLLHLNTSGTLTGTKATASNGVITAVRIGA